jgi:hypothetical protein
LGDERWDWDPSNMTPKPAETLLHDAGSFVGPAITAMGAAALGFACSHGPMWQHRSIAAMELLRYVHSC